MLRFSVGIAGLAALALPPAAPAQSVAPTAVISGTVTDSGGGPVSGVWILAVAPDQSIAARALSDSAGGFRLPPLPPASYILIATGPGFRMIDDASVTLGADPVSGLRIRMRRTSIPQPVPELPPPPATGNDSGGGNHRAYDEPGNSQRSGGRDGLGRGTPRAGGDAGRSPAGGARDARHPGASRPGGRGD